jgi:hypothetical protein
MVANFDLFRSVLEAAGVEFIVVWGGAAVRMRRVGK